MTITFTPDATILTVVENTYIHAILPLLQARVMAVTGWPAERVLVWRAKRSQQWEEAHHINADQYCAIRPGAQNNYAPSFEGGGRYDIRASRKVIVVLWTRAALDELTTDELSLSDDTLGHFVHELAIVNALAGFQPMDADQNIYSTCPMEPGSITESVAGSKDDDWTRSELSFDLQFCVSVDISYQ